jgi:hypothetical protein
MFILSKSNIEAKRSILISNCESIEAKLTTDRYKATAGFFEISPLSIAGHHH